MPDILHWLGITKIDNMVSMSDMKYDAIVKSGIPIKKRYDIPGSSSAFFFPFVSLPSMVFLPESRKYADISFFFILFLDHLIPPDSRVEIDAKIAAGYFSSGKQVTDADLFKTVGRTWEETEH